MVDKQEEKEGEGKEGGGENLNGKEDQPELKQDLENTQSPFYLTA